MAIVTQSLFKHITLCIYLFIFSQEQYKLPKVYLISLIHYVYVYLFCQKTNISFQEYTRYICNSKCSNKVDVTMNFDFKIIVITRLKTRTKCTYFQYKHAVQLAMLKHLYENHFCLLSYSILMKSVRYLR